MNAGTNCNTAEEVLANKYLSLKMAVHKWFMQVREVWCD